MGDELLRGQTWWRTDGRTDRRRQKLSKNWPKLASGKNLALFEVCSILEKGGKVAVSKEEKTAYNNAKCMVKFQLAGKVWGREWRIRYRISKQMGLTNQDITMLGYSMSNLNGQVMNPQCILSSWTFNNGKGEALDHSNYGKGTIDAIFSFR